MRNNSIYRISFYPPYVRYRHIEPGQLVDDTLRQVISGIRPDERYVTTALLKVRDGMSIKPIK